MRENVWKSEISFQVNTKQNYIYIFIKLPSKNYRRLSNLYSNHVKPLISPFRYAYIPKECNTISMYPQFHGVDCNGMRLPNISLNLVNDMNISTTQQLSNLWSTDWSISHYYNSKYNTSFSVCHFHLLPQRDWYCVTFETVNLSYNSVLNGVVFIISRFERIQIAPNSQS